jgi:surface antigen
MSRNTANPQAPVRNNPSGDRTQKRLTNVIIALGGSATTTEIHAKLQEQNKNADILYTYQMLNWAVRLENVTWSFTNNQTYYSLPNQDKGE